MEAETLTIKSYNRNLWFDFTNIIKKKKKKVWEELEPLLKEYIEKNG